MEIMGKIFIGLCFAIIVIILTAIVVFIALMIEMKLIINRRTYLKEQLTKEEARLFELSGLITTFTASINVYILELVNKRQQLLNKTIDCKCSPSNSLISHTISKPIIPSNIQN